MNTKGQPQFLFHLQLSCPQSTPGLHQGKPNKTGDAQAMIDIKRDADATVDRMFFCLGISEKTFNRIEKLKIWYEDLLDTPP